MTLRNLSEGDAQGQQKKSQQSAGVWSQSQATEYPAVCQSLEKNTKEHATPLF